MTNTNYIQMTNQELVECVKKSGKSSRYLYRFLKYHEPMLLQEIIKRTAFLENEISIMARIYCLEHNILSRPTCSIPGCNNPTHWKRQKFNPYCSASCCYKDEHRVEKIIAAFRSRYGVDNPMKLESIRQKATRTLLKKYGVEHPMQSTEIMDRFKKYCQEKYGVDNPLESDIVRRKILLTTIKRYGVDNVSKLKSIRDKAKQTNIQRYGTAYPIQSKYIQDKLKQTIMDIYGVENVSQSDEIKERIRQTNMERYGVEYPFQCSETLEKIRRSMKEKYGVEYYTQTSECWDKIRATCNERYGYDYYQQSPQYYANRKWKFESPKYPNMTFATSWEFKVYDFLTEHHISFEYQPAISIPYECEGTQHTYHPDFLVGDRMVEVKGDNFFRINEETGQEEMYLTWKGDLSDEEYELKCKIMEAKHQCMIANNVIILRGNDINNLDSIFLQNT